MPVNQAISPSQFKGHKNNTWPFGGSAKSSCLCAISGSNKTLKDVTAFTRTCVMAPGLRWKHNLSPENVCDNNVSLRFMANLKGGTLDVLMYTVHCILHIQEYNDTRWLIVSV